MASYRDRLPASGGASEVLVQRSTMSVSGSSIDITISAVDMAKTYIKHRARQGDATARDACYSVELINPTTVRIIRSASASISVYPLVSVEVVTDSSCSVQRGTSATATTVTIASVNQSKSFVNVNGVSVTATTSAIQYSVFGRLTSDTALQLQAIGVTGASGFKWEVITYA